MKVVSLHQATHFIKNFGLFKTHSGKETLQCDMSPSAIIPVTSNIEQEIIGMELIN